jgi:palmitoyl transferase
MRASAGFGGIVTAAALGSIADCHGESGPGWGERIGQHFATLVAEGDNEIYLPFRTQHLRFAYTREKIAGYEETPLGMGIGRGRENSAGNWEGLFAMGFKDSHSRPQWLGGYGWKKLWQAPSGIRLGLGYTAFLTTRSDIGNYKPLPGILPLGSIGYRQIDIEATYVPGGDGYGNILFFWAKWRPDAKERP